MRHVHITLIAGLLLISLGLVFGCKAKSVDTSSASTAVISGQSLTSGVGANVVLPLAFAITASPSAVSTNGTSQITVHVVDGAGNIVPDGTVVKFSLDNGLKGILSSTAQATVNGDVAVTFTAGSQSAVAIVTATIGSATVSTLINISGTTPASVIVTAATTSLTAGENTIITATVTDSLGKLVSGATISFSTDPTKASLSTTSVKTDSTGKATITLTAVAAPYATVDANCLGAIGSVSVNIGGAAVAVGSLAVSSSQAAIVTGGNCVITALLRDAGGQPLPNATVSIALSNTSAGSFTGNVSTISVTTNNAGVASVTFTAAGLPTSVTISGSYLALGLTSSVNISITSPPPANIVETAAPTTIPVGGTASITAVVTDANGNPVLDGTQVNFSVSDNSFGSLSNTFSSTSGGTGTAIITLTAANKAGAITISAVAGTITKTVTVTITPAPTGSIQFVSAQPTVIGIKGSGQQATSTVTFKVFDINGNAVSDGTTVNFTMQGPGGGAYIGSTPGSATAAGSTVAGVASVILNSGSVAGPVTIIATTTILGGGTISTSAGQISIGGGVPSYSHFNLTTSKFNLPGFVVSGATANIGAYLADRFGNYNVLKGTSISFITTEGGAIDPQGTTDNTGLASVVFRTQAPMPNNPPVAATVAETNAIIALNGTYGLGILTPNPVVHPRNGWVTILATVQGEESFNDENGDGLFTNMLAAPAGATACPSGYTCECHNSATGAYLNSVTTGIACPAGLRSEAFIDISEPFLDVNDDGCRNNGSTENCNGVVSANTDPFELFIDVNNDSAWNPPNGVWDGPSCTTTGCLTSKMIWRDITLAFTGNADICNFSIGNSSVQFNGVLPISFVAGDFNTNMLVPNTTITVSSTGGGTLSGMTSVTVPDGVPFGPTELFFNLAAPSCTLPCTPATVQNSVTVTVSGTGIVGCTNTISGTFHN